jgi:hypothetical protein
MDKKKINEFIIKWIYQDLSECYWDELWESVKKGSLRDSITLDHQMIDDDDYDYDKVWDDFWKYEHPFFKDLDNVIDKWRTKLGKD